MTKPSLKIGPLPDKTPIKHTIAIDPDVNADLELYAKIYEQTYQEKAPVAALIPFMLQAFLASDTGFKKARKACAG
jgi:hypothetical protein